MTPMNGYGLFCRPRRGAVIPFEERISPKGERSKSIGGVSPEGNGVARDRLPIFGTEADSEVLQ